MPVISSRGVAYDSADVERRLVFGSMPGDFAQRAVFLLARGNSVWNPASTKRLIFGPARVEFTRYAADGGVTVYVGTL